MNANVTNPYYVRRVKRILPCYLGFCGLCLLLSVLLMLCKFHIPSLIFLGLIFIGSLVFLLYCHRSNRKELAWERDRYDLHWEKCPDKAYYDCLDGNDYVRFFPTLLSHYEGVAEFSYEYEQVRFRIWVSNFFHRNLSRVNIYLRYDTPDFWWSVPLTAEIIHMIYRFHIRLENPEDLEFLLRSPEEAIRHVATYATLRGKTPDHILRAH